MMGMGILDGKVAIVTGASRGIGAQIARRFGEAGAAVAVSARTTEAGISPFPGTIGETAEQIRAAAGTAVAIRADLSTPEDREWLVSEATRQLGPRFSRTRSLETVHQKPSACIRLNSSAAIRMP